METHDPKSSPVEPVRAARSITHRWWLNLALLIFIVALGALVWYRVGHPPQDSKPRLTQLDADAIRRISIERPNRPPTVIERTDDGWRLAAPIRARADNFVVDGLLRVVNARIDARIKPEDSDLARYGLAPPALRLRLDDAEIGFGEQHPLKDQRYVQYANAIYLVSSSYYAPAAAKVTNFIDARLIEPGRKPVAFKLPGFTLAQKDGTWERQPEIKSLSSDRINAFVDEWRHARALQVEQYSGDKPHEQVTIEFEEPNHQRSQLTIAVLQRKPELVLARPDEGLEYHFPAETAARLLDLRADADTAK